LHGSGLFSDFEVTCVRAVHASPPGGVAESQAGCTIWHDVSKETFEQADSGPANDWGIHPKESDEPKPEAVHGYYTSKKDKKKKAKTADLRPSWMVESPAPTTDLR
jgi:hypothetical protein